MPSTYSPLKIELPATGEQSGTWGNTTNTNLGTALEEAIVGSADVTFASGNVTLTLTDTNASQPARNLRLNLIGVTGGSTRTLTVPAINKLYLVSNNCADAVVVGNATGATVTVPAGNNIFVYNDGTDVLNAITYITALNAVSVSAGSVTTTQVDIVSQGDLRLQDTTGGQFVALQAPGTIATSYTLTLPVDDGTTGQVLTTDGSGVLSWTTDAGGDVVGPASATDNAIARFDLTTGKIIQNSVVTIADTTGNMAGVGTLSSGAITTTGVLTVPAGTVSAPAITTTGDTNTGIFFPAADTIAFTEGGVEAMRINSSGFVGIGTSSPGVLLDVSGGLGRIIPSGGSVNTPESGAGTLNVYGASSDISTRTGALRIESFSDSGANVGTGIAFSGRYITSNAASWTFAKIGGYKEVSTSGGAGGYFAAATATSGGVLTERMRITSDGNVGIGTSSPSTKLHTSLFGGISATIDRVGDFGPSLQLIRNGVAGNAAFGLANNSTLAIYTNSTERMRIDSSGRVGIGTSSPAVPLDIVADSTSVGVNIRGRSLDNSGSLRVSSNDGSVNYALISASSSTLTIRAVSTQPILFNINSVERMRLDSAGNLGLGVTPSAWSAVYKVLQVSTNGSFYARSDDSEVGAASNAVRDPSISWKYVNTDFAANYLQTNGAHVWQTAPSGTAGNAITFTQAMTLDASGNLQLGTTTSGGKLTIKNPSSSGEQDIFVIQGATNTTSIAKLTFDQSVDQFKISANTNAGFLVFGTGSGGSERMRITSAGNVGIGTSSPAAKLDVVGSKDATNFIIGAPLNTVGGGALANYSELLFKNTSFGNSDAAIRAFGNTFNFSESALGFFTASNSSPIERVRISPTGNVGIGTSSPAYKLHVNTTFDHIHMTNPTTGTTGSDGFTLDAFGTSARLIQRESAPMEFYTAATERMRIDSSGNVLVGTTSNSPASRLLVAGGTFAVGTSGTSPEFQVAYDGTNAYLDARLTGGGLIFRTNGSTERMRIDSSGRLLVGTTSATNNALLNVNGTGITGAFSGFNSTVTTTVSVGAGTGGAMCLIRGVNSSGVSYSSLFLLAIKQSGGAAPDLASTLISNVGGNNPTFTFSSSGGFITVANSDSVSFNISFIGL